MSNAPELDARTQLFDQAKMWAKGAAQKDLICELFVRLVELSQLIFFVCEVCGIDPDNPEGINARNSLSLDTRKDQTGIDSNLEQSGEQNSERGLMGN